MADNAMLLEAGPRGPRLGGKRRDGAGNWRERLAALFPEAAVSEARVSTAAVSEAKDTPSRRPRRRAVGVAVQVAVVCAAAAVLLLRVAGIPAWDGTYAEDNGVFLVDALVRPWHLLVPYSGYLEMGPRVIGQIVASFLPIVDASVAYAITGALIGGAAGLFLYHASGGYIRAPWARALLGGALVLLPIAPLDIIDSGVDSPWYAMAALFFAVLWRPRSWPGMLAAALVACYASSSEIVAVIYAPLLLIRLIALPRVREHAVTAGWLLGLMLQVPVVMLSYTQHKQRLGTLATPGQAVAFYCHNVILRALGWHLSIWLKSAAGYNGATAIVGVLVALAIGWAVVAGDRPVRLFAVIALLTGFVQTIFDATISQYVIFQQPTPTFMAAARYSTIPVLLIAATGIAAVDSYIRRHRAARESSATLARPVSPGKSLLPRDIDAALETNAARGIGADRGIGTVRETGAAGGIGAARETGTDRDIGACRETSAARDVVAVPGIGAARDIGAPRAIRAIHCRGARPLVAACLLVCVLGFGWVADFRYASQRINAGRWLPYAQSLVTACTRDPAGAATLNAWGGHHFTVPCARIRR
jgi:hypothetical protein